MKKFLIIAAMLLPLALGAQEHKNYNLPEVPQRARYIDFASLDSGLWFAAQLGPAYGFAKGASAPLAQLDLIAGYRFNEFIRLGLGLSPRMTFSGGSYFPVEGLGGSAVSLPIYLDVRGNMISQESRMVVPYWNLDLGYTLMDGLYMSPTIGIRVGPMRNDFIVGLTYIFQSVAAQNKSVSAIGLRLGFEF